MDQKDIHIDDELIYEFKNFKTTCYVIAMSSATGVVGFTAAFNDMPPNVSNIINKGDINQIKINQIKSLGYIVSDNIEKFYGKHGCWISDLNLVSPLNKSKINNGCNCKHCGDHYPMAEPNQTDGTLVCWSCRTYPMRKYY